MCSKVSFQSEEIGLDLHISTSPCNTDQVLLCLRDAFGDMNVVEVVLSKSWILQSFYPPIVCLVFLEEFLASALTNRILLTSAEI